MPRSCTFFDAPYGFSQHHQQAESVPVVAHSALPERPKVVLELFTRMDRMTTSREEPRQAGDATKATAQECAFPLSLMQESLWFIDQIMPASGVYNIPEAWQLEGPLDVEALRTSLDDLAQRHESL